MLSAISDPSANLLAVITMGLEEMVLRCTTVRRDVWWDKLMGYPEPDALEVAHRRKVWAACSVMSMFMEVVAIITSKLVYILMRPHRFVFNLGYGFDANDSSMIPPELIMTSLMIELGFEGVVDCMAIIVEHEEGVDTEDFWQMWRVNPINFWGVAVMDSTVALVMALWAFTLLPSPFFCNEEDNICSCKGAGFDIFEKFCKARRENMGQNLTSSNASNAVSETVAQAKTEFLGFFVSLGPNLGTVGLSVGVIVLTLVVFAIARILNMLNAANIKAEKEREAKEKLIKKNERVQKQLMLNSLNETQVAIVNEYRYAIEEHVPEVFQLNWRKLTFEKMLGSGSFGDCYKGRLGRRAVAIKKMRIGMIDEDGFTSFSKEVVMLSVVDHENIVEFCGYVLHPCLLIVMEYVSGGCLSDFIQKHDLFDPPSSSIIMTILSGCAAALEHLHGMDPHPIIHRDIKPDNIFLTKAFEPKLGDLGEACIFTDNGRKMTIVGTDGRHPAKAHSKLKSTLN